MASRKTLQELRSLSNVEKYLQTARAELASHPCDDRLRAFFAPVESLFREEKDKLKRRIAPLDSVGTTNTVRAFGGLSHPISKSAR